MGKTQTSPIKAIFGFLTTDGDYPQKLVTVVMSEDAYHAVYSTGDHAPLINGVGEPSSKSEVSTSPRFFPAAKPNIHSPRFGALTSFAFAANHVVVGTPRDILKELETALDHDQHTGDELVRLLAAHQALEALLEEPFAPPPEPK
jgi:hypothetical protein